MFSSTLGVYSSRARWLGQLYCWFTLKVSLVGLKHQWLILRSDLQTTQRQASCNCKSLELQSFVFSLRYYCFLILKKKDSIFYRINQYKTGPFVSVPLPTGVPQSHLCSRESIFIPPLCNILKLAKVLRNSLLQCATPSHMAGITSQNLAGTNTSICWFFLYSEWGVRCVFLGNH